MFANYAFGIPNVKYDYGVELAEAGRVFDLLLRTVSNRPPPDRVIGALAVVGHGLSRATYDGDIWLEPMS